MSDEGRPAGLGAVHHVGLATLNLERLQRFYTDILGFQEVGGFPEHGIVFLDAGGLRIELLAEDATAPEHRRAGWQHLAWGVPDVEAVFALLVERGATVSSAPESFPPDAPIYRIAFLRDPDGNLLELIQRLDGRAVSPSSRESHAAQAMVLSSGSPQ